MIYYEQKIINLKTYNIGKIILFAINICSIIYFSILLIRNEPQIAFLGSGLFFLVISLVFMILCIICLNINIEYVQNFMNYQYENYEEKKCGYIWDLLLVFLAIFFFIYFTIILIYKFLLKDNCISLEKFFKSPENVISQNPVIVNAQENKKIKKIKMKFKMKIMKIKMKLKMKLNMKMKIQKKCIIILFIYVKKIQEFKKN